MCRVVTALIDGGQAVPDDWRVPISQERRLTLHPNQVLLGARETVASTVPELTLAENNSVAARALEEARRTHGDVMHADPDPTLVTVSAMRLAKEANETDAKLLGEQLAGLEPVAASDRPVSVLEKVHGAVLGGIIRSRLDAERWERAATSSPAGPAPDWWAVARRFRWFFAALLAVMSAVGFAWQYWHSDIVSALGISVGVAAGMVVLGVAFLLLLVVGVY